MTRTSIPWAVLCVVLCPAFVHAAPDAPATKPVATRPAATAYKVPGHGDLELVVPGGWKEAVRQSPRPGLPPTIEFAGGRAPDFSVQITPIPGPGGDPGFNSPARLKKVAEGMGGRMLAGSKESSLSLEEVKGDQATGYFYALTDKDPAPGSFEYVTGGVVGVGDLILSVTILYHRKDAPEPRAALDMLGGARQAKAVPATRPADLRVKGPGGAAWELVVPAKGLEVVEDRADAAGKVRQVTAVDRETGLVVSVFMEPARRDGDSTAVRDAYWGRAKDSPLKKDDVKLGRAGDYATVQYTVPEAGGERVDQRNLNVYIAHDGVWVDVHVSKAKFIAKDQAQFDAIAGGTKVDKAAAANPRP